MSIAEVDSRNSSQEAFEAVQEEVPYSLAFRLDFHGLGLSLVNRKAVEVVYLSLNSLHAEYTNSPVAQAFNLACGSIQIDNQLHDALFPVVLQPTPVPKDASTVASLPTLQASMIWLKDEGQKTYHLPDIITNHQLYSAWCHLHQVLFHSGASAHNSGRRRLPLFYIRPHESEGSFLG